MAHDYTDEHDAWCIRQAERESFKRLRGLVLTLELAGPEELPESVKQELTNAEAFIKSVDHLFPSPRVNRV